MNHQEVGEMMSLALDGMASAEEERALQAHLAECPACQAEWEALRSVSHLLTYAPLASPGVDLTLRVERRLRQRRERRRWAWGLLASWLWLGLTLFGLVVGSTLLGWLLLRQPTLVSLEIQLLARLLMVAQAALRALWLLATSLPSGWLAMGISAWLVLALMLLSLWAWLGLGRQRRQVWVH